MAGVDQGNRRGHMRNRHAAAGHAAWKGLDGHLHCGSGAADSVLRGAE